VIYLTSVKHSYADPYGNTQYV